LCDIQLGIESGFSVITEIKCPAELWLRGASLSQAYWPIQSRMIATSSEAAASVTIHFRKRFSPSVITSFRRDVSRHR